MRYNTRLKKKYPKLYKNRHHIIYFILALIIVFIFKFPVLNNPFHWDVLGYVLKSGLWFKSHSFFTIAQPDYGHPPLLFWLLGLSFRIFSETRVIPHLINIGFSFIGVYYTYLLGSYLYNKRVGVIASVLLFFSPFYFAQSGILNTDISCTAMSVVVIYYALRGNLKAFLPTAAILVLTKETGVFVLIALIPYLLLKRYDIKKILLYLSPSVVLIAWLLFYKLMTEEFFHHRHVAFLKSILYSSNYFKTMIVRYLEILFISNYNFLISIIILSFILIILLKKDTTKIQTHYIPIITLFFLYIVFYSIYNQSLLRHILPLFPFFYLIGSNAINNIFKKYGYVLMLLLVLLFITKWTGSRDFYCGCDLETNMEYLDLINTHKQAATFIERNYPDARVLTSWPQILELNIPIAGYVENPIDATLPEGPYFSSSNLNINLILSNHDLIYYSPQANIYYNAKLIIVMESLNLTLLEKYESNNKYTEVYLIEKEISVR